MNTRNIKQGIYSGLIGGMVFGGMMGMMGMLPMIGRMVGHPSAVSGFLVHLIISAGIGAAFAVWLDRFVHSTASGVGVGMLYGSGWWVLGSLTLMPWMMGMGLTANWSAAAAAKMLPSLMGHLMYGAILGAGYVWLRSPDLRTQKLQL